MCIIACKPMGVKMPDDDTIENMWFNNSDGAGIMYAHGGKVHIEKGFMTLDAFTDAIERIGRTLDLTNTAVVMHFRITTHGGTKAENTHPFPISDNVGMLKKLRLDASIGVAHNGIIHNTPRSKDISDTMEYIMSQLAPLYRMMPKFYENKDAMLLVKNAIQSKMAFLTGDGNIRTIGDFEEHDGIMYSNHTWKYVWYSPRYMSYGYWDKDTGKWEYDNYKAKPVSYDTHTDDKTYAYDDDFWVDVEPHFLMPISDVEGSYFKDNRGELFEDDNYDVYMDYADGVWVMDSETGVAFYDDTIVGCYTKDGVPLRYDYQLAERIDCYDFWGNVKKYDRTYSKGDSYVKG